MECLDDISFPPHGKCNPVEVRWSEDAPISSRHLFGAELGYRDVVGGLLVCLAVETIRLSTGRHQMPGSMTSLRRGAVALPSL
jgi:hypothetical protein